MDRELTTRQDKSWAYMILPVVVLFLGSGAVYATYFALASAQPSLAAAVPLGQVTFAIYTFIAVIEWILAFTVIRKLRRASGSAMDLIAPCGDPWRFRWLPAILVFLTLNGIFVVFMGILSGFVGFPYYEGLHLWQRLVFMVIIPITAGFCEELIWRGYVITRLEARGRGRWTAILLAAVSFALIHGSPFHWVFTFLFGIVAGFYYTRERNLVPLMISHAAVNLWSFGWYLLVL